MDDRTSPILEARGLTRRYDDYLAVNDVSLSVRPGEVLALLGPNGAGKTTLLRMLFGVLEPHAGEAFVDGISVRERPLAARARIGFASGDAPASGRLTVRKMLR